MCLKLGGEKVLSINRRSIVKDSKTETEAKFIHPSSHFNIFLGV